MRIKNGSYKGLTAHELVERDPRYAEWFWQHADRAPMELRQEVRAVLVESRLDRLSDQYDRLSRKMDAMKRQHARERIRTPSAEEINFEKVRADRLQQDLADAYQMLADKDREMDTIKEAFKKLRTEYARMILPPSSSSTAGPWGALLPTAMDASVLPLDAFMDAYRISADPSADQGAHCRPWTPASLSLFRCFGIGKLGP